MFKVKFSIIFDVLSEPQHYDMARLSSKSEKEKYQARFSRQMQPNPVWFGFVWSFSFVSIFVYLIYLRLEATYPTHNTHGDCMRQTMESSPKIHLI